MMNTESKRTKVNTLHEITPPGWQIISEMEKVCEICGEIYYKRISYTDTDLVDTVRSVCSCLGTRTPQEIELERKAKAQKVQTESDRYFAAWDLLKDEAHGHMSIDGFKPKNESHEEALMICRNFTPSVVNYCLFGRGGRGKTHIAVAMARQARQKGYSALAIKSIDLLNRLRKCYQAEDSSAEIEIMRLLKQVDMLVIDDLGAENMSQWVRSKFYEIIDYRYNRRSTIFTTNLSGKEMESQLGMGTVSRVWARQIEMTGEDHRLKEWAGIGPEVDLVTYGGSSFLDD